MWGVYLCCEGGIIKKRDFLNDVWGNIRIWNNHHWGEGIVFMKQMLCYCVVLGREVEVKTTMKMFFLWVKKWWYNVDKLQSNWNHKNETDKFNISCWVFDREIMHFAKML